MVASSAISIDKEKLIGEVLMRQLRAQAPIINDPLIEEYIQDLGNRLVAQADNAKFPFRFFPINNDAINAFAFYGGHIGVHTGLLVKADSESELASVVAHEIAHVTQRHIARSMEARQNASPLQVVSMLGGILLALANPEAGMAAISAGQAAGQQAMINYTRSNEKEADRVGIEILARAGFEPQASASFFGKLAAQYRYVSKPPAFLMTHPLPESRVADMKARVGNYPAARRPESLAFQLVKARILARYSLDSKQRLVHFRDRLENARTEIEVKSSQYGLALALLADEQYVEANGIIAKLLQEDEENLFYIDTFTDISLATGQNEQAISRLSSLLKTQPRNRVLALNLANALIQNKEYNRAVSHLKDYLLVNPDHLLSYQLLTEAYGESGQKMEMHQARAEVYALNSAYTRAVDELKTAYNFTQNSVIEKQRILARIEQMREAETRLNKL
ncbi:putative beta-barrel assembly-enhancing protease [Lacimicrobium alkaliphilum]|uniref:Putative beta-barrel assembly-enhancing protease n=1 Tax=Lacimicrobium alkaliphilum TaxID=1526571 RepID=A0ABQ1QYW5_9ALTE|nr:putative beta-barrel assembly-enhancing protease [Lacimicrobium alkaliphilum]